MTAHGADDVITRAATADDARAIAETLTEAFHGYLAWAPPDWSPPLRSDEDEALLAKALSRPGVWCLLATAHGKTVGHVALAPFTMLEPQPPPPGTINLWQLFVRPAWQGSGVAVRLIQAAIGEAQRRGFTRMRLWTPRGATRARRFYEREGWTATGSRRDGSPFGLPVVQYARALEGGE